MEQEEAAVIQLQALTDELDAQQGSATSLQLKERLVQVRTQTARARVHLLYL